MLSFKTCICGCYYVTFRSAADIQEEDSHRCGLCKEFWDKQAVDFFRSRHQLAVVDVPGDGNCALHALLKVSKSSMSHVELRTAAVDWFESNSELTVSDFFPGVSRDQLLVSMRTNGAWINIDLFGIALSAVLKQSIEVWHWNCIKETAEKTNVYGQSSDAVDPLRILRSRDRTHYLALIPCSPQSPAASCGSVFVSENDSTTIHSFTVRIQSKLDDIVWDQIPPPVSLRKIVPAPWLPIVCCFPSPIGQCQENLVAKALGGVSPYYALRVEPQFVEGLQSVCLC